MNLLLVMLGGAIGSGARYLVGRWALALLGANFPWGTLAVNLVGGLLMGLLTGGLTRLNLPGEHWRLLLAVGVLGGFTTFSSFALETANLLSGGGGVTAAGYVAVSVIGAIAAVFAGLAIVRAWA
jgi:fluoride exporter